MTARRPRLAAGVGLRSVERSVEEGKPAGQVRLDRELSLELVLQAELLRVVPLLVLPARDEGPERAALVAVDEVHAALPILEGEKRSEELPAKAAIGELGADEVGRGHEVFEILVADDDPLEAEAVRAPPHLRARIPGSDAEQLVDLVFGPRELAGGEGLEDDRRNAGRLEVALRLERDRRSRKSEELVEVRALELLPPEEDVPQAHLLNRAAHLLGDSGEPRQALLERRVSGEELTQRRLDRCRDDEEGVHAFDLTEVALRNADDVARDLLERAHQLLGSAREEGRTPVGGILAVARDHPDQDEADHVSQQGDDEDDQPDGRAAVAAPVSAAEHAAVED